MGIMEEVFSHVNNSLHISSQKTEEVSLTPDEKRDKMIKHLANFLKIAKGVNTNKYKRKKRKKKKKR